MTYPFVFRSAPMNAMSTMGSATMTPVIRNGTARVRGSLDRSEIQRVIRRNHAQVRYCYERELQRVPNLSGRLTVRFEIGANGRVTSASVTSNTMNNTAVAECIERRVQRWRFPQPRGGGSVVVSYPFVFNTR